METLGPRSHTSILPRGYVFDPIPVLTTLSHLVRSGDLQVEKGMQMMRPAIEGTIKTGDHAQSYRRFLPFDA